MTQTDELPIVTRHRANDAEWQKICDRWAQQALDAGSAFSAEQEATMRRSLNKDSADLITELVGALRDAENALDLYIQGVNETDPSEQEQAYSRGFYLVRNRCLKALVKAGAA
jgi:hypothetical protein